MLSEDIKLAIWIGLVIWNLVIILRDAEKEKNDINK